MSYNEVFGMKYTKLIILSQIGAQRYLKLILKMLLLSPSPFGELCTGRKCDILKNSYFA